MRREDMGTPGLNEVLHGGLFEGQTAIVSGGPGSGKTILSLQFLAAADGPGLYIPFEEREVEIRRNAANMGIDLDNVTILDMSADKSRFFDGEEEYTIFPEDEVEGEDIIDQIADAIDEIAPERLVIDPLSELRSLLPDEYQFRRNISSLINELKARNTTSVCTTQPVEDSEEDKIQYLGDTTIELRRTTERRTLEVTKFRGSGSEDGLHTYRIFDDGAKVFPKISPESHTRPFEREVLSTGVEELDTLFGGGINRGTVTIITGPSGVGKSTLSTLFLRASAQRDEMAVGYLFEELRDDFIYRSDQLGMAVGGLTESGKLQLEEIESLELSPDEFGNHVRTVVEEDGAEFVVIDGISGYQMSLRGEEDKTELNRELHALCRYLKRIGVTVLLIEETSHLTGDLRTTDNQLSYLADNIVFLRYLEIDGEIDRSIGMLKKRYGGFERSIRQFTITENGVQIGEKLSGLRGLLTGVPERTSDDG